MGAEPQTVPDQEAARRHHDPAATRDPALAAQRESARKQAHAATNHRGPVPPLAHPALTHPANAVLRAEAARRVQQQAGNRAAQHAEAPESAESLPAGSAAQMTDGQAQAALLGEWLTDANAGFVTEPVHALFDPPRALDLRIPVQPASPKRPPAGGDPKVAIGEVQAGYGRFLSATGRQHDDVAEEANRILRALDAAAEESLRQTGACLMGPLATEMAALAANRRQLEESLAKAQMALHAQAAAARRQIS